MDGDSRFTGTYGRSRRATEPARLRRPDRPLPQGLERLRTEFEALAAPYHVDNVMRLDYLLTRAAVA